MTQSPQPVGDQGHDADGSCDAASTSDSGRGNSEDGDANMAKVSSPVDASKQVLRRSSSPVNQLRTFTSSAPSATREQSPPAALTTDSQFKLVYARPANVIAGASSSATSRLPSRSGAVVSYGDMASSDPKRARVYYKNFPTYQTPASYRPGLLDASGNITTNSSTFV